MTSHARKLERKRDEEIYFESIENVRRLVVKAHNFEQKL